MRSIRRALVLLLAVPAVHLSVPEQASARDDYPWRLSHAQGHRRRSASPPGSA